MSTTLGAALLPATLRTDIGEAIKRSAGAWDTWVESNRADPLVRGSRPLAVKYVPSRHASTYRAGGARLVIGSSNFTWGRGTYVTGVQEPLSTATYGRAGIVATVDPKDWSAFDARVAANPVRAVTTAPPTGGGAGTSG
jgi:hypothetical protein